MLPLPLNAWYRKSKTTYKCTHTHMLEDGERECVFGGDRGRGRDMFSSHFQVIRWTIMKGRSDGV